MLNRARRQQPKSLGKGQHRRMSLKTGVGAFCVAFGNGRIVVGVVGMWECGAISKGGGKRGKPGFGFPRFPPSGISTTLFLPAWRLGGREAGKHAWLVASGAPPQCRFLGNAAQSLSSRLERFLVVQFRVVRAGSSKVEAGCALRAARDVRNPMCLRSYSSALEVVSTASRHVFRFHQAVVVGVPRTRLGLFDQQLVQ